MNDFQDNSLLPVGDEPDPFAETQPTYPQHLTQPEDDLANYQPIPVGQILPSRPSHNRASRLGKGCLGRGCWLVLPLALLALVALVAYLLIPPRTNVLILGVDDRLPGGALGRSDTMILVTFQPAKRYIGMLSIPRDLWVQVPGIGPERINTAHFYAEAQQAGSGPQAAMEAVQSNFGVDVHYYVRARFDNFMEIVDVLGGVDVFLPEAMSGYPAGVNRLDAEQALAFVRDRSGSDDFSRMGRAQILLRSLMVTALSPVSIPKWPQMALVGLNAVETDIPIYLWPKYAITLLLVGMEGIDGRTITREMVFPFTTSGGAQVLEPRWDLINPVLLEMFGQ
jgi:polyisoprenyl-teichoic acid--peptidoglycan teichoic acid transferase